MHQHDIAAALFHGGHQRRSIDQSGPGLFAQIDFRLGQYLTLDQHLLRHGKPGERAFRREGGQSRRLAPGHGATQLPVATAQAHRQQVVGILRQLRPGKTDQHAALVDPGLEPRRLGLGHGADVGHDQHRQLSLQQGLEVAVAELGIGCERPLDVERFTQ